MPNRLCPTTPPPHYAHHHHCAVGLTTYQPQSLLFCYMPSPLTGTLHKGECTFLYILYLSYIWRARHNHWPNREKSDWNNKNNNSSIEMKNGSRFYVPFVHIKCQCPSRFNPNHHHHSIKRSIDRYIDLPFTFIISIRVGDARTTDQMTKTAGWQAGRLLCDRSQSAQSQPASHRSYSRGQALIRSKYDQAPP